jgi:hypothetical protein
VKRFLIYVLSIIILIPMLQGCKRESVLTNNIDDIKSIHIYYKDFNKSYTMEKDNDKIKSFYDSVMNTKVKLYKNPGEINSQNSEPIYTLEVSYKNGDKDIIKSTETGKFIYRLIDDKGSWIGGKNEDLITLIK